MGGTYILRLMPVGRLSFKPPQPFTAGIHGPGSIGSTLSYPMPSTIAGLIAGTAYRSGCRPARDPTAGEPFADTLECIRSLLGEEAIIYTGLLAIDDSGERKLYVYVNHAEMPLLNPDQPERCLREYLYPEKATETCEDNREACESVRAIRHRVIGIGLNRSSKSVSEGLFYSLEYFVYNPRASILAVIAGASTNSGLEGPVKLGTKTGIAVASTKETPYQETKLPPGNYRALLISPALLREAPTGPLILSSAETARWIAEKLLKEAGLQASSGAMAVRVPRGEHELGVISPGWSLATNRPRPPLLLVPPGTLMGELSLENARAVRLGEKAYLVGLGCCSQLGWGTALLVPEGGSR